MDGVIINTENTWQEMGREFLEDLYGSDLFITIRKEQLGMSISDEYELAKNMGLTMSKDEHLRRFTEQAKIIFDHSKITDGAVDLINLLDQLKFKIAIVSSSPLSWINLTLAKIPNKDKFSKIISLNDRQDLRGKPAPDGYLEIMRQLQVGPNETIILEDSNRGLEAATRAGAFTICLQEHLPKKYISGKANLYVAKLTDLVKLLSLI